MKRLQIFVLAGIFLLCVGAFNAAYCNTDEANSESPEVTSQSDEEEMYSHESVLPDDLDSEYEEPKTDDVITNDDEETEDDSQYTETMDEGEEV